MSSVIGSTVVSINIFKAFNVPFCTGIHIPEVILSAVSASTARVHAPAAVTYIPFSSPLVWFFTSIRLVAVSIPSNVCSPESVIFAVVVLTTGSFQGLARFASVTASSTNSPVPILAPNTLRLFIPIAILVQCLRIYG